MVAAVSADRQFEQGARPSRTQVVARYSGLARVAAAGGAPVDTPDEQEIDGCGGAVYAGSAAELRVPEGALRASMACGNPVAIAELFLAIVCWIWAPAVAWTCCCRLVGSALGGSSSAWTRART
jgi:hypothetical protein